ncbi:helix-turn-helix domain-containing protein [Streptomyces sp. STCH 565 A]|uniref:helix-turn-helix domain-containing protein n=1 Tax=Streptomyces sp. STCH 565 A TaxID=2950532 RepID=UPI002075DA66|nr:helix-turn-helix domain-containing protein [Streptomyces sp. STCH 565 A]MCM8550039.1 helix-turn-helix domain-containing protein [Streptomyces sp. STCH 565 A]
MTRLPELPAEPRHSRGGAGGAGPAGTPAWHRQKVKVPKRVWGRGAYSPGAAAYWVQIAALAQRADGCRAGVATLAGYLGDAKRTAERYLAELSAPGPDGVPELTTVRHTRPDGDGETAERRTRPVGRSEHFAYVPVLAAKMLRRPLFVLYCALTYAEATSTPVTAAELAALLAVTEFSARRMTNELERLGWITVHRRAGVHGRHLYEVHDQPLAVVDGGPDRPHTDGGSGACADGGSLAIKEDAGLTDESSTPERGGFRRRRDDRKWGPDSPGSTAPPVDTLGNRAGGNYPVAPAVPPALRGRTRPAVRPAYAGPPLTLSRDAWGLLRPVLAPVADLLPDVSPFMTRRIVREVLRQIRDDGVWPEEIRDQVARLRRWTPAEALTDPGRWLLGAVLPVRSRCGMTGCHWGFLAHTGTPCKACAEIEAARGRAGHPPHTGPRPHACTACGWGSTTPLPYDRCAACRPA